jgi:hypothetical protein
MLKGLHYNLPDLSGAGLQDLNPGNLSALVYLNAHLDLLRPVPDAAGDLPANRIAQRICIQQFRRRICEAASMHIWRWIDVLQSVGLYWLGHDGHGIGFWHSDAGGWPGSSRYGWMQTGLRLG